MRVLITPGCFHFTLCHLVSSGRSGRVKAFLYHNAKGTKPGILRYFRNKHYNGRMVWLLKTSIKMEAWISTKTGDWR